MTSCYESAVKNQLVILFLKHDANRLGHKSSRLSVRRPVLCCIVVMFEEMRISLQGAEWLARLPSTFGVAGFESRLHSACTEFACPPCASGVSSWSFSLTPTADWHLQIVHSM